MNESSHSPQASERDMTFMPQLAWHSHNRAVYLLKSQPQFPTIDCHDDKWMWLKTQEVGLNHTPKKVHVEKVFPSDRIQVIPADPWGIGSKRHQTSENTAILRNLPLLFIQANGTLSKVSRTSLGLEQLSVLQSHKYDNTSVLWNGNIFSVWAIAS